jgi:ribosome-associated protein
MQTIHFKIEGEYINLLQLLKATNLSETGGQSKEWINEGSVMLNGQVESRLRAKIRPGDRVQAGGVLIIAN